MSQTTARKRDKVVTGRTFFGDKVKDPITGEMCFVTHVALKKGGNFLALGKDGAFHLLQESE